MSQRVLIVGSIALDNVKTPFGEEKDVLGGSTIFGSISASTLSPVDIVGVVGEDFPQKHFDRLRGRGINTAGVETIAGGKTFRWGGEYVGDMDEAITHFTDLNVFEHFSPAIPRLYCDDAVVFLANIDPELQLQVLDQMHKPRLIVCDTMNFWIESKRDKLLEVLRRVDVALLNAGEARMLFGVGALPRAGAMLLELGLRHAIIKKGEHGVMMFSEAGFFSTPAIPLDVVLDPTGAGDAFAGGFSGYLARIGRYEEEDIRQAIITGSAMASFVVEDFSTRRLETVDRAKLMERCNRLTRAMHVKAIDLSL